MRHIQSIKITKLIIQYKQTGDDLQAPQPLTSKTPGLTMK